VGGRRETKSEKKKKKGGGRSRQLYIAETTQREPRQSRRKKKKKKTLSRGFLVSSVGTKAEKDQGKKARPGGGEKGGETKNQTLPESESLHGQLSFSEKPLRVSRHH